MGDYIEDILDKNELEQEFLDMLDSDAEYSEEAFIDLFSDPEFTDEYYDS